MDSTCKIQGDKTRQLKLNVKKPHKFHKYAPESCATEDMKERS